LSTAEVEAALVDHKSIAESAAVSALHPIKGECIYCFIVLKNGFEYTKMLELDLKQQGKQDEDKKISKIVKHVMFLSFDQFEIG
jgi:PREDICTED: similar to ACSS2 protein